MIATINARPHSHETRFCSRSMASTWKSVVSKSWPIPSAHLVRMKVSERPLNRLLHQAINATGQSSASRYRTSIRLQGGTGRPCPDRHTERHRRDPAPAGRSRSIPAAFFRNADVSLFARLLVDVAERSLEELERAHLLQLLFYPPPSFESPVPAALAGRPATLPHAGWISLINPATVFRTAFTSRLFNCDPRAEVVIDGFREIVPAQFPQRFCQVIHDEAVAYS